MCQPSPKNWVFGYFRLGLTLESGFGACWDRGLGLGLDNKGPIAWNTDLAMFMSNISSNGYWSSLTPPTQQLGSIIDDLSPTNGLVRYNTEAISVEERRWWNERNSGQDTCEKDRLRDLYGAAVEHANVLKTELTQMNRTADLFQKRNSALHEELETVKRRLNESERKRYAMSSSSSDDGSEEKEDRRIEKIVKKVLGAYRATTNVPPELSREEKEYYGLIETPYHSPKDPVEGGLPGQRRVVEKEEEDPVFVKAYAKLRRMSAEKAAVAASNAVEESSPKRPAPTSVPTSATVKRPASPSPSSSGSTMPLGTRQGSTMAPGQAVTLMAKKRTRAATSSSSSTEGSATTRPKPSFRNSAQGASGSGLGQNPAKKPCKGVGKKKTPPPYHPEVKFSLALARAGALKARHDLPADKQVGDNGPYIKTDEEKENLRDEKEAEPDVSLENIEENQESVAEDPMPNTSHNEDDVLNINISEQEQLDFEPEGEEIDDKLLDDTKVYLSNTCIDLRNIRNIFRTRPLNLQDGIDAATVPGKLDHEWIFRYLYIYNTLFMKQLFLYLFILCSQSYLGANQYCMLKCLIVCI